MATKGGTITRKDVITDEALQFGNEYAKQAKIAISANSELIASAKELAVVVNSYRKVENNNQFVTARNMERLAVEEVIGAIKKEEAALISAEKIKQSVIDTEKKNIELYSKKANAQRGSTQLTIEERVQNEVNNKVLKQEARERLGLVGAYEKLNSSRAASQRRLADLLSAEIKNVDAIKRETAEFNRLEDKIRKVDSVTNNYTKNIGNYKSATQAATATLRDLISALGVVGGITAFASIARNVYEDIKALDSMNKALRQVTETENNYIKQKEFLRTTSEKYGAEIKNLTKDYTSFFAATKGTNLEGAKTQKIFDSVIKTSSSLGKTQEETTGILLALSQMMSKGKVSAEELRGQLGERMPGAFKAMADSMGVTTAELDKMLQKGEVIAEDVLPNFATQLEKTFGVENVNRIENIQAAQNRLSNSWTNFIEDNSNGLNEKLAKALGFLADNLQSIIKIVAIVTGGFIVYKGVILATEVITKVYTATTYALRIAKIALSEGIAAARAQMLLFNTAAAANPIGAIAALLAIAVASWYAFSDAVDASIVSQKRLKEQTDELRKTQDAYNAADDKFIAGEYKRIENNIKLRKAQGENSEKLDKEEIARKKEVLEASIASNNGIIEQSEARIRQAETEARELAVMEQKMAKARVEIGKFGMRSSVGKTQLQDELDEMTAVYNQRKLNLDLKKNQNVVDIQLLKDRNAELKREQDGFDAETAQRSAAQLEKERKAREKAERDRLKAIYEANKKAQEDQFKLDQFRIEAAIDINNEIVANEKNSLEERVDAYHESYQLQEALSRENAEFQLSQLGKYNEKTGKFIRQISDTEIRELINTGNIKRKLNAEELLLLEKYYADVDQLRRDDKAKKQALIDSEVGKVSTKIESDVATSNDKINAAIEAENTMFAALNNVETQNREQREAAIAEHERKILEIKKKAALDALQIQIDGLQKELDANDAKPIAEQISADKRKKIAEDLQAFKTEKGSLEVAEYKENSDKKTEIEQEFSDSVRSLSEQLTASLADLANSIMDTRIANIDYEIQKNNDFYEKQIELAGDDQRKKDILQKQQEKKNEILEKKKRQDQYKQAVFNKTMQAIQAGGNIALAVTAALTAGPGVGIALSIITAALGAIQLAAILAAPIPKAYKMGRKGGAAEVAIVGDGGVSEVITDKFGNNPRITPSHSVLTKLEKDDMVHPNVNAYRDFMKASILRNVDSSYSQSRKFQGNNPNSDKYSKEIADELRRNTEAVKNNKPIVHMTNKIDFGHEGWRLGNINWNR